MGSFIADLTFRSASLPDWGQTVLGAGFRIGAGGKGSNQAVAGARLGATVSFITMLGADAFGELARRTWEAEGINTDYCGTTDACGTGAASVVVHDQRGENAIVVDPGSGMHLAIADVERAAGLIGASSVFMTQLELDPAVVTRGLELAHAAGTLTILNPAPALPLAERVYGLCDCLTPNESEATRLSGFSVRTPDDAARAARVLRDRGARGVVVTLGSQGALVHSASVTEHVPAFDAGPVVETTGAGDAFNGALAVGLSEGMDLLEATRFGCAVAGLSVTLPGTSASMPRRDAAPLASWRPGSRARC